MYSMPICKGVGTNYGKGAGLQNGRGGGTQVKFYPYKKGGRQNLSHAEGVGTKSFEVVLTRELEVLAILMGGRSKFWTRDFPIF